VPFRLFDAYIGGDFMKLSMKSKMIIILVLIIVGPVSVLGVSSYTKARSVFLEGFRIENNKVIEHTNHYFLTNFMDNIGRNVEYWAKNSTLTSEEYTQIKKRNIKNEWQNFMKANPDLLWIYFGRTDGAFTISPYNNSVPSGYDPRKRIWYLEAMKKKNSVIWTSPYIDAMSGKVTISAASTVKNPETKEILGVVGIDFNLDRFSNAITAINKMYDGFTIIIDNKGIILNHPDKKYLGKDISKIDWVKNVLKSKEGDFISKFDVLSESDSISNGNGNNSDNSISSNEYNKYFISYATVAKTDWKLISLIPTDSMQRIIDPIRDRTLSVAIISIICASLIGIWFSARMSKKINNIVKYMEEVEQGNLTLNSHYYGDDVFGILNKKFNEMAINISKMLQEAKMLSNIDGLTKLYNHLYCYERLEDEIRRANRYKSKLCVIMIDIDHFKDINDTFGHQAGDKALVVIANTIKNSLRELDIVGRYGGEEFLAILPEIGLEECFVAAERIRKNVENLFWEYTERQLTVSIGIAEFDNEESNELVEKADILLYRAKNNGRNRIEH
jgi:diguanylate cyclase (GGDEF)-like protein